MWKDWRVWGRRKQNDGGLIAQTEKARWTSCTGFKKFREKLRDRRNSVAGAHIRYNGLQRMVARGHVQLLWSAVWNVSCLVFVCSDFIIMVLRTIYFHLLNLVCCMEKNACCPLRNRSIFVVWFWVFFEVLTRWQYGSSPFPWNYEHAFG